MGILCVGMGMHTLLIIVIIRFTYLSKPIKDVYKMEVGKIMECIQQKVTDY